MLEPRLHAVWSVSSRSRRTCRSPNAATAGVTAVTVDGTGPAPQDRQLAEDRTRGHVGGKVFDPGGTGPGDGDLSVDQQGKGVAGLTLAHQYVAGGEPFRLKRDRYPVEIGDLATP